MIKLFVVFALVAIAVTNGAVWISVKSVDDPQDLDYCSLPELNMTIPKGKKAQNPNYCEEISCSEGGLLEGVSCGKVGYDHSRCVSLGEDLSKPYPECCERIKCIENTELNNNL